MELSSSRSPTKTKSQQPFPSPIFSKDLLTTHSEVEPDISAYCFWSDFCNKKKSQYAGMSQIYSDWGRLGKPYRFFTEKEVHKHIKIHSCNMSAVSSAEEEGTAIFQYINLLQN